MTDEQRAAIEQLRDRTAAKRETAARKLGRKPCPEAGPALLEAFRAELEDSRTWKAKVAQADALADNPHPPALGLLLDIAGDDLGGEAVNASVGSAAMACGRVAPGPDEVLRALLGDAQEVPTHRVAAVAGALDALARDPHAIDGALLERVLAIAEECPPYADPDFELRRLHVTRLRWALAGVAPALPPAARARVRSLPQ